MSANHKASLTFSPDAFPLHDDYVEARLWRKSATANFSGDGTFVPLVAENQPFGDHSATLRAVCRKTP
jgi:hypothetical protein